jgi:opacity protein-like surface antigen
MDGRTIFAAGVCAAAMWHSASAQDTTRARDDFDFTVGFPYLQSERTSFDGGTVVDTDASTGIGFSFDWAFADRWSAGATLAMHDIGYTAKIALEGAPPGTPAQVVRNDLDTQSLMGQVKRHFGRFQRVSPYATGALGWVSIDTNIPNGPPVGYCWFDPWWGPTCSSLQPTHTTTELGTALGVGVRWDFSRRFFLDASVGREWIDFDNANRPDFTQLRVAFGVHDDSGLRGRRSAAARN